MTGPADDRPGRDAYFLALARVAATRGTCARRRVGAVLVSRVGHVLATGYNGVPMDSPHCRGGVPCPGAAAPAGEGLAECDAIHAEMNALLQCQDVWAIEACYVTASPCVFCVRLLLNTACRRIVYAEEYPHPRARWLWERAGRAWARP